MKRRLRGRHPGAAEPDQTQRRGASGEGMFSFLLLHLAKIANVPFCEQRRPRALVVGGVFIFNEDGVRLLRLQDSSYRLCGPTLLDLEVQEERSTCNDGGFEIC